MKEFRICFEPQNPIPEDGWDTAVETVTLLTHGENMENAIELAKEIVSRMGIHMQPVNVYMRHEIPVEGDDNGGT